MIDNSGICEWYDCRTDEDKRCIHWSGIKYDRTKEKINERIELDNSC